VTHLHWDHVQGLPFFVPIDRPGARLDIYGPPQQGCTLEEAFEEFMRPPYFPVRFQELRGQIAFHDFGDADVAIGDAKVRVRPVPHIGATNGYRVELGGASVAYISDHQQPRDGSDGIAPEVMELCDGADLLVHDAQYTNDEFTVKSHWGHCTVDYAIRVAKAAGVRHLALFHHDPSHDDDFLDDVAARCANENGVEVFAAAEGLTISLGGN
jgi:phosphoribosyl 1,2-cyclic phosphodiesterase